MIANNSVAGLIVATCAQASPILSQLIDASSWPVMLRSTPRKLRDELSRNTPAILVFWLDDRREIDATTRLLVWLAEQHTGTLRIAVAHQLGTDVEATLRTVGVDCYLAVDGCVGELIKDSVLAGFVIAAQMAPPTRPAVLPRPRGAVSRHGRLRTRVPP